MEELIDAIYNTYAANSTLSASLDDLHFARAPDSPTYPYGVYYINSKTQEDFMPTTTSTNEVDIYAIQFSIWDDQRKRTRITGIESDMEAAFDDKEMTVVGFSNSATIPEQSRLISDPERTWHLTMDYRVRLRKT